MTPHSRTFGQGPRKALAIHCTLAHSGAWRGVAAALKDRLTLLAYDLPCHGKSPDWDGQGDMHDLATQWGHDLLDAPMDVIGHSFGATVALRLAVECPDLVRSATLIEPVFFAAAMADDPARVQEYHDRNRDFAAAMQAGDMMVAARAFNRGWGDGTKWDEIPQQTRDYMAHRIHFVAASSPAVLGDSPGLLEPGRLDACPVPVLLLEGDRSDDMTDAVNTALARRLPNVRRTVLNGIGHMAPITHPAETAAAIAAFLDTVPT